MKRVKGNGISKKYPPCIQKNISGGREMAGMNQLFLLIYYHKSIESTRDNKEKQPKPVIFIKISTLLYFQNYTNWSNFPTGWFEYGARVDLAISCHLISLQSYASKLYLYHVLMLSFYQPDWFYSQLTILPFVYNRCKNLVVKSQCARKIEEISSIKFYFVFMQKP